ncbi:MULTISPECIES: alpha-mannosidase [unclassified Clostridioides]|uniref:alpha-mannosidase n=1 Tax=unclassified Clostridioides TaxID=2635829 RepID=UPI001D11B111|nr:alpha-mannosidase [Clostridioides sp. ES-S-0123-01]UDN61369.1 alpha-mannosidase [Clostridioides sp. ES-W-0016-02]
MIKAHIVNHTHWDREWYFTSGDALVLSEQLFTDIIDELERNPDVSFVLDGQLSILDDYTQVHKEKIESIKKLIEEKRLYIGPWFTQTDAFFARGESILRNLMIGIFESKKYGEYMKIGYLPDTFGFNAQMPILLRHVGIDNIFFWRGIHLGKQVQSPYFKWKSLNGEKYIYAVNMPHGYGTGMLLEPSPKYVNGRLDPAIDFIKSYSDVEEVLIPSGNDQLNIIGDFKNKVEEINNIGKYSYITSSYQDFLKYVKSIESLESYRGEFREPVLARIHKSIGSSRMDIKLACDKLENKLIKRIEPLLVIAKKSGIEISNQLLINTWKKLLEGQAHDSLAGCVTDTVTDDILHRIREANEICDSIENTIVKKISEGLKLSQNDVLVFNSEAKRFNGYKEIQVVSNSKNICFKENLDATIIEETYIQPRENVLEETPAGNIFIEEPGYYILKVRINIQLPALGYKVISFETSNKEMLSLSESNNTFISNDKYKVIYKDGSLDLQLKDGTYISNFLTLKDSGNAGDTYDFSPLQDDDEIELLFNSVSTKRTLGYEKIVVEGTTLLPLTLEDRKDKNLNGKLNVRASIILSKDNPLIEVKLHVNNTICNHRLRVHVKTDINDNKNIASLPFGYITRENGVLSNWENTYSEMPIDLEPLESNITLTNDKRSCTVFTRGIKEYQHVNDEIALTLLATTDELGKPDLLYRPGRASGDTTKKGHIRIKTEKAQILREVEFSFAIYMSSKSFDESEVASLTHNYLQESINYQLQDYNFFLYRIDNKIQRSIVEKSVNRELEIISLPENYLVSACYLSYYDKEKFVIRLENPTSEKLILDEQIFKDRNGKVINAIEELEEQQIYEIAPFEVISILLDL